jgi:hypothetical protein
MLFAVPNLVWTAYRCPKAGHTDAECEDAYAADPAAGRFAVADGASESAFAREWAEAVTGAYVTHPGPWSAWLPLKRADWFNQCKGDAMPWYVEAKFEEGAFATLLGLELRRTMAGRLVWQAQAVGDCCLFQIRHGHLHRAFPVKRSIDFDNRPALLRSRPTPCRSPCKRVRKRGRWRADDVFLLMTDALAQWFLMELESNGDPWSSLKIVDNAAAFIALVGELRVTGRLRNDDCTLLRVHCDPTVNE